MDLIKEIKDSGCYKKGQFILKSGELSNHYIDLRKLINKPKLLKKVSSLVYEKVKDLNDFKIIGIPYGGMPHAYSLSLTYNIPCLLLRKEFKNHGTKQMVEGDYQEDDKIILIEDVLTTGTSIFESLKHLNKFNIEKIIVIVDRKEGGKEKLESYGFKVESIFTIDDFIN